jgi:hypothetical protein
MTVVVRPVHLEADKEELLGLLQRNLRVQVHPQHDARRFEWLYRGNPAGMAWSWFAYEKATNKNVGVASVFPRAMWVGGKVMRCGLVGDFAVDASHRSMGPALMLQRATFEPVQRGELAFCYDCPPHARGMSLFHRLGMDADCQIHRYARLLRTDRQLGRYLGWGRLAASLVGLGNLLLALWSGRSHKVPGLDIALHEGRFGEEFSALDQQVGGRDPIRARRTAEDLNWRYRDDPLRSYQAWTARRGGELAGFAIFSLSAQDARLMDLFGIGTLAVSLSLLEVSVEQLRRQAAVQTLQAFVTEPSDVTTVLHKARFRYRSEAGQVVAYAPSDTDVYTLLTQRPVWALRSADISAFPRRR